MPIPMDLLGIVAISVASSLLIEFVQWVIIYRKPKFRQFKERLAVQSKKLDGLRGDTASGKAKGRKLKQERLEKSMQTETARMFSGMKLQQMLITMGTMMATYKILSALYTGRPVARLPFEPWPFFRRITHRLVPGEDWTDASVTVIFSICTAGIRANIGTWMGLGPNRQMQGMMQANNALIQQKVEGQTGITS